tara:strand:- start:230 stop:613 length:384 start_codon:yes stop_codon:yes gene_type:complete
MNNEKDTKFKAIYDEVHNMVADAEQCAFLEDVPCSHWNNRWTPEEDNLLRKHIDNFGTKWKFIQSIWPSNIRNRKASELRHRWTRIRKGEEGVQICNYCGNRLRGHSCPILSFSPHVRNIICKKLRR